MIMMTIRRYKVHHFLYEKLLYYLVYIHQREAIKVLATCIVLSVFTCMYISCAHCINAYYVICRLANPVYCNGMCSVCTHDLCIHECVLHRNRKFSKLQI